MGDTQGKGVNRYRWTGEERGQLWVPKRPVRTTEVVHWLFLQMTGGNHGNRAGGGLWVGNVGVLDRWPSW